MVYLDEVCTIMVPDSSHNNKLGIIGRQYMKVAFKLILNYVIYLGVG